MRVFRGHLKALKNEIKSLRYELEARTRVI